MPFCPRCKYEYVDGRVECIDCGETLVDELESAEETEELHPDIRFVAFRSYPSFVHAEMIREALANEGIASLVKGNEMFGSATGAGANAAVKVVVWVPEDDQEEAARIADSILDPIR